MDPNGMAVTRSLDGERGRTIRVFKVPGDQGVLVVHNHRLRADLVDWWASQQLDE